MVPCWNSEKTWTSFLNHFMMSQMLAKRKELRISCKKSNRKKQRSQPSKCYKTAFFWILITMLLQLSVDGMRPWSPHPKASSVKWDRAGHCLLWITGGHLSTGSSCATRHQRSQVVGWEVRAAGKGFTGNDLRPRSSWRQARN